MPSAREPTSASNIARTGDSSDPVAVIDDQ
jgi:hypothetical protein